MRNNLKEFRLKLGFTQTEFAEIFGLTKNIIFNIETGTAKGSAKFWLKLQKMFNLSNEDTLNLMEVTEDERA